LMHRRWCSGDAGECWSVGRDAGWFLDQKRERDTGGLDE
jgi:hypothetical protein